MRATVPFVLALGTLALTACGGEDAATPTETLSSSPVLTTPAAESPTTTASKPKAPPEDGRHFGYLQAARVTAEPRELVFDLAYFLRGEEANMAAAERGFESPVPNDYFVVNDNPKPRTLGVAPELTIDLVDWKCCDKRFAGDPARFEASFAEVAPPAGRYRGRFSSYWLTVEDGVVVSIEEQYLP